jgi:phosphoglycerate dehydrogenase-like enzyme
MTSEVLIVGRDADFFVENLAPRFPALAFRAAVEATDALSDCAASDILLIRTDQITARLVGAMPRLRLIQALTTGTDHIEALQNLPAHVMLAAARGFHGPQMSELAFLFMLHFNRNVRKLLADQSARQWDRREQRLLLGKTCVLVGVGRIAEALAQRCNIFGMTVIGVSDGRAAAPGFDLILPRARLPEAAAQADFMVVLVPYGRDTHHLIDAAVLAAMKPSGVLINIARGGVVDEAALIAALQAKKIAGAGLDVFQTEPLPQTSPLWDLDNVLLTSHVGGMSDIYARQVLPLLIDNLAAFVAGKPERMQFVVRRGATEGER